MDVKHKKCRRNYNKNKQNQNKTRLQRFFLFILYFLYIFESSKEIFTEKQKQNNKKTNKQ